MSPYIRRSLWGVALLVLSAAAAANEHFDIVRFQIDGNTLLSEAQLQAAVAPSIGHDRDYGDVQRALEALELAYRDAGYSAVQVAVPEQELTGGSVRIQISESVFAAIVIDGNRYFSEANIRASLPALRVGRSPNLRALSQSIQLANDNPAKQVAVTLAATDEEGKIAAKVAVVDHNPLHAFVTLDNTGTSATGKWRTGVALQHANLFDRDQVGTLAYTTAPDHPGGVDVNLYSLGYRIPLYTIGDSIDFIYGKSDVNTPSTSPTLGGLLGFTGKGDVYGLRWNHFFARAGEYTSKLVFGFDDKKIDSRCDVNGQQVSIAPPTPPLSSCVPYETRPFSITYSGQRQSVNQLVDYNIGLARNWATGTRYTNLSGRRDRYSYLTPGNRDSSDSFMALRAGASIFKAFASDWQVRVAGMAQYSNEPLVSSEQFGLTGATAVRGFNERSVAADSGAIINAELYTPELADKAGWPGNLRLLTFADAGRGYNNDAGGSSVPGNTSVDSIGAGARYVLGRDFNVRLDVARVNNPGGSASEQRGDWHAHLSATLGF